MEMSTILEESCFIIFFINLDIHFPSCFIDITTIPPTNDSLSPLALSELLSCTPYSWGKKSLVLREDCTRRWEMRKYLIIWGIVVGCCGTTIYTFIYFTVILSLREVRSISTIQFSFECCCRHYSIATSLHWFSQLHLMEVLSLLVNLEAMLLILLISVFKELVVSIAIYLDYFLIFLTQGHCTLKLSFCWRRKFFADRLSFIMHRIVSICKYSNRLIFLLSVLSIINRRLLLMLLRQYLISKFVSILSNFLFSIDLLVWSSKSTWLKLTLLKLLLLLYTNRRFGIKTFISLRRRLHWRFFFNLRLHNYRDIIT